MATFGQLRDHVLKCAGVADHFAFTRISSSHRTFWEKINRVEYERGYNPEEYEKPESPALYEMDLLTPEEYTSWIKDFESFHAQEVPSSISTPQMPSTILVTLTTITALLGMIDLLAGIIIGIFSLQPWIFATALCLLAQSTMCRFLSTHIERF